VDCQSLIELGLFSYGGPDYRRLAFDSEAIVLAKASTLGIRAVSISTVGGGGGTSGMFMYALIEKARK
jgi:hypothetical protein